MQIKKRFLVSFTAIIITLLSAVPLPAQGLPNLFRNVGKTVEADPNKEYLLNEMAGPYLIFAMSFSGPSARQDANELVLDFRRTFKWEAYLFEKTFIRDVSKEFKPKQNPYFPTKFSYVNSKPDTEYAVLVGNFLSMEDKQFEKTLAEVRKCLPESMKKKVKPGVLPFAVAFGLTNPMLPPENPQGYVDSFIESINSKRPYTLLRNPRRYTIRIATFRGGYSGYSWKDTSKVAFDASKPTNQMSDLEKGEQMAVTLCKALRARGVEAYEFHDRNASYVTVGSFNHYGQAMPDGTVMMDQQVQQMMQQYQGQPVIVDGRHSFKPVTISGINCDPEPKIIDVPRVQRKP